uniref:serine/threonine protein kinase n=1 Tax=Thaumasiovibrio occultus TaxID=1891184 RepID=UPI000B361F80|nr:serine/threonine protein kinase [Thaumasiovibrio occultus]
MTAFTFSALTPDVQLDALDSVGVRAETGLTALNSYENRVYQFGAEDGKRYVVKFYRPERWSEAQIIEEHQFAIELAQGDIPLVAPVVLNNTTLHHFADQRFALYPSVGGRQFEVDNWDQLAWVGRYLGRIHQCGSKAEFQARPTMGLNEYLLQSRETLLASDFIPDYLQNAFFSDLDQLINEIEQQWHTDWTSRRLHGDCHPGNILWRDGPLFVDLDDARNGPAVQDLWMLLNGERHDKLAQLDTILEEYEQYCDFNHKELQLIEPLRGLRMVHYMAWLARRWQDPAFPLAFPWFADGKYWEGQVLAFKEQIAALREPPLSLTPQY